MEHHIIFRNETLWLPESLIMEKINVSYFYLKKVRFKYRDSLRKSQLNMQFLPDSGRSWRYGKMNGVYYYDYDRIPDRKPAFYRSQLPTREELISQVNNRKKLNRQSIKQAIQNSVWNQAENNVDNQDIQYYMWEAPVTFPPKKAQQLAMARQLCNVLLSWSEEKTYKKYGINRKEDFWAIAAELTNEKQLEGLKIDTPKSLRKKVYYEWPVNDQEAQRKALISSKYGNNNRALVGKYKVVNIETGEIMRFDVHEAVIYNAWMNPGKSNKLHKSQVYQQYLEECEQMGIDAVSERTVSHHLNRFAKRALMSYERDGRDHFTSTYQPYIPQFKPQYSGTLWVADFSGTKLLFRYKKTVWRGGKKVQQVTSGSWYLLRIVDAATDYIVGWVLVESGEDWKNLLPALNMALEQSDNHAALEFVTDNGPAFTSEEGKNRLAMLFKKHRRIAVGNKQANKAETYVRLLSDKARKFGNWARLGFYSRHADNVANPDYMDLKELPWKEEAMRQVEILIHEWNHSPRPDGSVPAKEYAKKERRNPQLQPVSEKTRRYVFGTHTTQSLERCRGVFEVSKGTGEQRTWFKFAFKDWLNDAEIIDSALYGDPELKVKVAWDENGADIYTPDGRYITTAEAARLSHPSEFEATEDTIKAFESHTENKKRYEKAAKGYKENLINTVEALQTGAEELDYIQRASLNNGKAKEEHNKLMESKTNPLHEDSYDEDTDFDVRDSY